MIAMAEAGQLPDGIVRMGMRRLIDGRRKSLRNRSLEQRSVYLNEFAQSVSAGSIAVMTEKANEQHYEVPADFFVASLGKHLKYSCCYWDDDTSSLNEAEANALERTCINADLKDGQDVLELGCGWGSLSLWMAEHFPSSRITSVSNSSSQKAFIDRAAEERGLTNLEVVTADVNDFATSEVFDRVVSVEMFEHVQNHASLMKRIGSWLRPGGKLFVHIFCHDSVPYLFLDEDASNWMTRYFFSGGMMPSRDLLLRYQSDLHVEKQIYWDGTHYQRTANAWLKAMDERRGEVERCFREAYGADWKIWIQRWRMFYMACAELFGFDGGREWYISHYLFSKPEAD